MSARTPSCYSSPKVVGTKSEAKGNALFAEAPIARGEVIAVFGGRVVTSDGVSSLTKRERRLMIQVDEDLFLSSETEGPGDWVNHSCEPNAGMRGPIVLVAMRRIHRGEEICFDYAMTDGCPYDEFPCSCGTARCRERVTGDDWQNPALWRQYGDHFSPYLAERIRRLQAHRPVRSRAG